MRVAHTDGFGVQAFIACELDNESLAEGHETNKWNQKRETPPKDRQRRTMSPSGRLMRPNYAGNSGSISAFGPREP
ncbi:hypothetical protein OHAE_1991 [Ochrobactrum soli]|uniref:Uncharacterized protein n=1 Tax=Ochrobactrum soli TaxID=2448455 RepID=A0A2P9HPR0_9HYPH|nr:hypothetical protein OHAE_1991 [[Ochrobactrum] soli]